MKRLCVRHLKDGTVLLVLAEHVNTFTVRTPDNTKRIIAKANVTDTEPVTCTETVQAWDVKHWGEDKLFMRMIKRWEKRREKEYDR